MFSSNMLCIHVWFSWSRYAWTHPFFWRGGGPVLNRHLMLASGIWHWQSCQLLENFSELNFLKYLAQSWGNKRNGIIEIWKPPGHREDSYGTGSKVWSPFSLFHCGMCRGRGEGKAHPTGISRVGEIIFPVLPEWVSWFLGLHSGCYTAIKKNHIISHFKQKLCPRLYL